MAKLGTLFVIALLLFLAQTGTSTRPEPLSLMKTQKMETDQSEKIEVDEERCEGAGKEECLMRRTLAAHVDYIYTQKQKP
ncbi:hypothetical protein LguiA_006552 [Lonicera macranthoides]